MPNFDSDSTFEPIKFKLGGKEYTIETITDEMEQKVDAIRLKYFPEKSGEEKKLTKDNIPGSFWNEILEVYTGEPSEFFEKENIIKKIAVCGFITDFMAASIQKGILVKKNLIESFQQSQK